MSTLPWRNWYHCMANTYGTWLPGDGRGFRTRHHREHVEGDYKNPPPPGRYDQRYQQAKGLMQRDAVLLAWEARVAACRAMVEALLFHQVDVAEHCVTEKHLHTLARFTPWPGEVLDIEEAVIIRRPRIGIRGDEDPRIGIRGLRGVEAREARQAGAPGRGVGRSSALDDPPRHYLGIAKKRSARALSESGLVAAGGVWAKRGKIVPIEGRGHFEHVVGYIRDHVREGGAVYSVIGAGDAHGTSTD